MAIKRTIRYSLILILLVIVALLVAPLFINVQDIRLKIEQTVEDRTGRALRIGDMKASLFPWVGVHLTDVRLANAPGFSNDPMLKLASLDVKVALLPLLGGRYEIKSFAIDGPELVLERKADGATNWQDLLGPATSKAPKTPEEASAPAGQKAEAQAEPLPVVLAERLELEHGRVLWRDEGHKPVEISGIALALDGVQLTRPVALRASARVGEGTIRLSGELGPIGDPARLDPGRLPFRGTLDVEGLRPALIPGAADAWPALLGRAEENRIRLHWTLEQHENGLRVAQGEALLTGPVELGAQLSLAMPDARRVELKRLTLIADGKELAKGQGRIQGLDRTPRFSLRLTGGPIERTWLAERLPVLAGIYAGHPSPWRKLGFGLLAAGNAERLDIRDLQLNLDGERVQMVGFFRPKGPEIRMRIAADTLHLDPWLPPKGKEGKPGASDGTTRQKREPAAAEGNAGREPDLRFLKPLRADLKLQIAKLKLHGLELGNLQGTATARQGVIRLAPLRFNLAGGLVEEQASLDAGVYPAAWTESLHVSRVQVEPVLKALAGIDMLTGRLEMETSLKGRGIGADAVRHLNGRGRLTLRDGMIRGFDLAATLRHLANPLRESGRRATDFAQLSGSFTITNGRVRNEDLFLASPLLRATGQGTVDLVAKTLDYHIKPRLVGTLVGQGDTATVRKGLAVPLRVHGPLASPKVTPEIDVRSLIENAPAAVDRLIDGGKGQPNQPGKKIRKAIEGLIPGL